MAKKTRKSSRSAFLVGTQVLLTLITGWLAFQMYLADGGSVWFLFAVLAICSFVSIVFRTGWIIPCTVLGTIIGIFSDVGIKGGTAESRVWETFRYVLPGAIIGMVVGAIADTKLPEEKSTVQVSSEDV
jgi:hypothetical protein